MAREVIEALQECFQVPGWPGVYVLGCLDRRVTIYSQQVRALNLAAMLFSARKLAARDSVVVIGASADADCFCSTGAVEPAAGRITAL